MAFIHGIITPVITPFKADGSIDYSAYTHLLERQLAAGVNAISPCGTTGEATTLTREERKELIAFTVKHIAKRCHVMAGTGINSTREAIELAQDAESVGADSLLIVAPYYNKPTQEGLYQHYKAIHDATKLPIILYDSPRTAVMIEEATIVRLSALPRIKGLKDCIPGRTTRLRAALPAHFALLAGDDVATFQLLADGGQGVVSVYANVAPEAMVALYAAWAKGEREVAQKMQQDYVPLMDALFIETNPGPVKYVLACMGLCREDMRLPLVPPQSASKQIIAATFVNMLTSEKIYAAS